jgi:hypothetical protein
MVDEEAWESVDGVYWDNNIYIHLIGAEISLDDSKFFLSAFTTPSSVFRSRSLLLSSGRSGMLGLHPCSSLMIHSWRAHRAKRPHLQPTELSQCKPFPKSECLRYPMVRPEAPETIPHSQGTIHEEARRAGLCGTRIEG